MQQEDVETNAGDGTAARLLQLLAAVGLGCLVSVQARVSADLAERSDVYSAAWVTVVTGTLILLVVLVGSPHARSGFGRVATAVQSGSLPWWALLGGLAGMFFVVTQGAAAGVLGLAMFGMAVVAGQVVGGLVFDWIGLAGGERRSPTRFRVLGAVLAIAAVSWGAIAGDDSNIDVSLIAMAFLAGLGLAAASGVTGRVHSVARSVVTAGMLNHLVGLAVIVALLLIIAPESLAGSPFPSEPWLFIGGIIGPIGVAVGAILVHTLGVLLLGLGMVAGQLVGALVLEMVVPTAGVQASSIIGIVLTLLAVAITSLDGSRRRT